MADLAQKTWFPKTLNLFGQKKAEEAIQQLGRSLPCSVSAIPTAGVPIVTVKFEVNAAPFTLPNITVPVIGFEYIRFPIQVGCRGFVIPADVPLGAVSGLGGAAPPIGVTPGNLSSLAFSPIGNVNWEASDAPTKTVIYGPDGVVLRDTEGTITLTLTKDGECVIKGSGAAVPLVTEALVAFFNLHTHPNNGQPPTQQMSAAQLTTKLKAE